jgi:hypothetical protein
MSYSYISYLTYLTYTTYCAYFAYIIVSFHEFDNSCSGFELSDDENEDIEPPQDGAGCDHNQSQGQPVSAPPFLQAPPVPCNAPFNFFAFLRQSSGHSASMLQSIRNLDILLPPGPIIDHSERAGGGVR